MKCECGHPKTWHRIDGVCLRTIRHGYLGGNPDCNCEKFKLKREIKDGA